MTISNELTVKILRTKAIERELQEANALKQKLIIEAKKLFPKLRRKSFPKLSKGNERRDEMLFFLQIESSAESFDVIFDVCSPANVDRTISMLSGPFFTSKIHPIPTANEEMLYPIVQIDLRVVSSIIGESLGDGLLQVWFDINKFDDLIRVIPRLDVDITIATEFNFIPAKNFDGYPLPYLPNAWDSDPLGDEVRIMIGFKSTGMSCQHNYPEIYLDGYEEIPEEFNELLEKFLIASQDRSSTNFNLFGTFYPINYSAADTGGKCLFNISGDWGASGNAQVIYGFDNEGNATFSFWNSTR
jgi:hypothetical protein